MEWKSFDKRERQKKSRERERERERERDEGYRERAARLVEIPQVPLTPTRRGDTLASLMSSMQLIGPTSWPRAEPRDRVTGGGRRAGGPTTGTHLATQPKREGGREASLGRHQSISTSWLRRNLPSKTKRTYAEYLN